MVWIVIGVWYGLMSLVTFAAYGLDKRAAGKGSWRTKEKTLHLMALAGGWPGALAGQSVFRHKTRKTAFKVVLWAVIAVHVVAWGAALYLLRPWA